MGGISIFIASPVSVVQSASTAKALIDEGVPEFVHHPSVILFVVNPAARIAAAFSLLFSLSLSFPPSLSLSLSLSLLLAHALSTPLSLFSFFYPSHRGSGVHLLLALLSARGEWSRQRQVGESKQTAAGLVNTSGAYHAGSGPALKARIVGLCKPFNTNSI